MKTDFILDAALAIQRTILANEHTLESLDREIGDGDHYINMKRGATTVSYTHLAKRREGDGRAISLK